MRPKRVDDDRGRAWNSSLPRPTKPMARSGQIARYVGVRKKSKHRPDELERTHGTPAFREWVKTEPCYACGHVGYSSGAHLLGNDGMSRKKAHTTIAPLCEARPAGDGSLYMGCHTLYDQYIWDFRVTFPLFEAGYATKQCQKRWREYSGGEA